MNPHKILKNTRKQFGLSQVQMCKVLGVSQGALSKYEHGSMELPLSAFIKLIQFWIEKLGKE